jgi:hypothetical protein
VLVLHHGLHMLLTLRLVSAGEAMLAVRRVSPGRACALLFVSDLKMSIADPRYWVTPNDGKPIAVMVGRIGLATKKS